MFVHRISCSVRDECLGIIPSKIGGPAVGAVDVLTISDGLFSLWRFSNALLLLSEFSNWLVVDVEV